jgi:Mn2+/Fe2+ NRAMP family transporter
LLPTKSANKTAFIGAIFLMATSAVGPGFLTQTAVFTEQLMASFAFVILASIVIDIGAQLNIWQLISSHNLHAQNIAQKVLPGSGYALTAAIVFGGFAFNIGNLSGTGLGLNALFGISVEHGAILSAILITVLFIRPSFKSVMDIFTQVMATLMILLTVYVMFSGKPPYQEALKEAIWPSVINWKAIVTLVGGTVGGYISFAGAHRLLDTEHKGPDFLKRVRSSSIQAIIIASIMRIILFLAALGVVWQGVKLDPSNPPASVFSHGAGSFGMLLFGLVMWAAAITSVIGSAYTSISFLKTWHKGIAKHESKWIIGFIYCSLGILVLIGKPVQLLIWAGTINGFILPFALGLLLFSAKFLKEEKGLSIPIWQQTFGWIIVIIMSWMSFQVILG